MPKDYYRERILMDAVVSLLNEHLPEGHHAVSADDAEFAAGQCVVETLVPRPGFTTVMGGPDHATASLQVTSIGVDRHNARDFGSLVRQILTERDHHGALVNRVTWATGKVDEINVEGGFLETSQGVNSWVDSMRVFYQAHNP